jgi:hypothetical protein
MLFTTFLLATAVATALALGALLARGRPDPEPVRVPLGPVAVLATAAALTLVGFTLL